jgi:hypothetical protein
MSVKQNRSWWTREKVLILAGLLIIFTEVVNAEILGRTFHYEFLAAGLGLCGVGVAQFGDRK